MKYVEITAHGSRTPIPVEEPGNAKKAHLLATAPDELRTINTSDTISQEVYEWFIQLAADQTALSRQEIEGLPMTDAMEFCAEVAEAIFEEEQQDDTTVPTDGWMVVS